MKDLMVNRPTEIIPRKSESSREDDIDLRALLGVVNDHKWLILIGTALCFLASVFYVLVATPRYQASAMIQVERSTPTVPGQETPLALTEPPRSQASTEIPLLTSRTLLSDAVQTLKLDIQVQPQRFPLIGEFIARRYVPDRPGDVARPWFGLGRYGWGGEQLHIDKLDVPDALQNQPLVLVAGEAGRYALLDDEGGPLLRGRAGEPASGRGATMEVKTLRANAGTRFAVTRLSPLAAVTALAGSIEVAEQGRDSGIIAVTYENADPALAAKVVDHISSAYVGGNVQRNSAEAESSLQFVNEQLPKVRAELARAQDALNAFQTKVRTVDIDQETNSYQAVAKGANADVSSLFGNWIYQDTNNGHSKVLPSANLKFNMTEDVVFRFAASQTMTMPDFSALGASSWGSDLNRTGGGGNPNLKPVVSTNFDGNLEWYFMPRGLVSVGAFSLDLQDYVAFGTENRQLFSELTNQLETYLVSVPVNSNGSVTGLELVYEQPIGESFGFNANYTYADGKTAHTWADGSNNLVGTSKDTYNLGAYFENQMFSARANYTYRTSFLIGLSGANPYYQDDFGTLSVTLTYKPSDWLSLSLDALNLNSPELNYYQSATAPTAFYNNGRQFYLNLRAKF